jgi:hypothetical protein
MGRSNIPVIEDSQSSRFTRGSFLRDSLAPEDAVCPRLGWRYDLGKRGSKRFDTRYTEIGYSSSERSSQSSGFSSYPRDSQ